MRRRSLLCLAGAAALNLAGGPRPSRTAECEVPPECRKLRSSCLIWPSAGRAAAGEYRGDRRRLDQGGAAGASDLAYPHRLQVALAGYYPDVPIAVVNKGVRANRRSRWRNGSPPT